MATEEDTLQGRQPIRKPADSYPFNNLIADCARKLDSKELENIKYRFKDMVPAVTQTWFELFNVLQEKGFLGSNNIIYLQHIIRALEKKDLLEKVMEYVAQTRDDVLHFFEEKLTLPRGYNTFKIHVRGHNCQTQDDLIEILQGISKIVCVPIEDVSVAGIQESDSMVITIMLPNMYVDILRENCERITQRYSSTLGRLGIDQVIFDNKKIDVELEEPNEEKTSNEKEACIDRSLATLRHDVAQKEKQIKQLEMENLELRRKLDTVASTNERVKKGFKRQTSGPVSEQERNKIQMKRESIEETDILHTAVIKQKSEAPEPDSGYTSENEVSTVEKKMVNLAGINMSIRKLIGIRQSILHVYETNPGEITEKGLYSKYQRLYPSYLYYPQRKMKSKSD